jgi:phosphoribosylformylglycinamidine cyclo-ligase
MSSAKQTLSYKDAGVDIDAGDALVNRIKGAVSATARPEVLGGIGGFGGLFAVPTGYREPILVAATDGVGTKLQLALKYDAHDRVGIDLVAMCVNDLIVQGAEPLFFLDYYSTQRLEVDIAERVIKGIAEGCQLAGAARVGGETAEHPGMGAEGEYDLAGFSVGIVERDRIIDGSATSAGDIVLGLGSSGPHSNGFSLIRRVLELDPQGAEQSIDGARLIDLLLEPTRIYVRSLLQLFRTIRPHALAHITGGGLTENIPRVLSDTTSVELDAGTWEEPPVFEWLRASGIAEAEMRRTFNCGIGMVVIVAEADADAALATLRDAGEVATVIGKVVPRQESQRVRYR